MSTRESNDDRIALLQGTLDLLILKSLVFGPCHGQGLRDRFNGNRKMSFWSNMDRCMWLCSGWKTRTGFAPSGA